MNSALQARFRRVLQPSRPEEGVVALAHALLRTVYHVLAEGTVYRDLGGDYSDRQHSQRVTRRAIHLLERQGYRVTLESAA
jgi:transposase